MWGFLAAVMVALMLGPDVASARTPVATSETSPPAIRCDGWVPYRDDMIGAWRGRSSDDARALLAIVGVPFDAYTMVPPSSLRGAADALDGYALRLAQVDPLSSLQALHDAYVGRIVLISHYTRANADGDVWGIMFYSDQLTANQATIEEQADQLRSVCPDAWRLLTDDLTDPFPLMWAGWETPKSPD